MLFLVLFFLTEPHTLGTASLSARGSVRGVLDPDLKVKGVKGLRVIDASVFVRGLGLFGERDTGVTDGRSLFG